MGYKKKKRFYTWLYTEIITVMGQNMVTEQNMLTTGSVSSAGLSSKSLCRQLTFSRKMLIHERILKA
jgi:hypothetical protein